MGTVRTVTGIISADELGHCQPHEHLFVAAGPGTEKHPALLVDSLPKSILECLDYKAAGGSSLIDCQPLGTGRNASALKEISKRSGIKIIATTGYHLPHFYRPDDPLLTEEEEYLFSVYADELANGCREDRSVLPGAVKAALGNEGCEGQTEIRFRAAARAAAKFRVPLIVHSEKGTGALKAIETAREAGLRDRQIIICHADRQAEDFHPHDEIAAAGVMLEYDTIGRFRYHDDESEVRLICHMIEKGYLGQLLLSLDTTSQRLGAYGGRITLSYLLITFLDALREAGVSENAVHTLTRENPASIFC